MRNSILTSGRFHQFRKKRYVVLVLLTTLAVLVKRNDVTATTIYCQASNERKQLLTRCWKLLDTKTYLETQGFVTAWGSSHVGLSFTNRQRSIDSLIFRGGEVSVKYDEDRDVAERGDYDVDVEEEEYDEEDEEFDDEEADMSNSAVEYANRNQSTSPEEYDSPLVPSPFTNLFASIGVMILARKYDLFHPVMVRIARLAYILYMISLQFFLLFVRIKAKSKNDRTPLQIANPLSKILQGQSGDNASGENGGNMFKSLASSFLSSESTAVEYDLKQAAQMQRGLIFNMLLMWVLHFKMEQVQPLFINTVTGISNLVYSPLFQVYAMGRNLERPFKNPDRDQAEGSLDNVDSEPEDEISPEPSEDIDEPSYGSVDYDGKIDD